MKYSLLIYGKDMDLKEKLTVDTKAPEEVISVIKGMSDGDIEKVLQIMVTEIDILQKRVTALENKK